MERRSVYFRPQWQEREAVRAAVGDRIEIMVDANQAGVEPGHGGHESWGFATALAVARELQRMKVRWLVLTMVHRDHYPEEPADL